jgi:hypothetical protein
MQARTFVRRNQVAITNTKEELIKEINHYQAYWLSGVGAEYSNTGKTVRIVVSGLDNDLRSWLASRMR